MMMLETSEPEIRILEALVRLGWSRGDEVCQWLHAGRVAHHGVAFCKALEHLAADHDHLPSARMLRDALAVMIASATAYQRGVLAAGDAADLEQRYRCARTLELFQKREADAVALLARLEQKAANAGGVPS